MDSFKEHIQDDNTSNSDEDEYATKKCEVGKTRRKAKPKFPHGN